MFKIENEENVEIYFVCDNKEMELVEVTYDEIENVHYWFFNAYLAYQYWVSDFKNLEVGELSRDLIIVASSRYILYLLENCFYKNKKEYNKLIKDLEKIEPEINKIIESDDIISNIKKDEKKN